MTTTITITFCALLLMAYLFDLTSSRSRIPSVILLLLLGWIVRQLTHVTDIRLPDFSPMLPALGTIGLILIVLEGSLELELNKSKIGVIRKSVLGSIFPMILSAISLAFIFQYFGNYPLKDSLLNAIPFCVISSAIAIPSVRNLASRDREFIIYESSLSDIFGVLFFNFIVQNSTYGLNTFGNFGLQLLIIFVASFIAAILLALLLSKIEHHIKFIPVMLLVILMYNVAKIYHLPGLITIFMFGLFIGNLDELKRFKWIEKLKPKEFNTVIQKFNEFTGEASFLVRALFFLLFGYLMELSDIINTDTLLWSFGVVVVIFTFRFLQLLLSRLPLMPLLFIAPRGLITILLFLSIEVSRQVPLVNKAMIIQVILLTSLIMMIGLMTTSSNRKSEQKAAKIVPSPEADIITDDPQQDNENKDPEAQ